MSDGDDPAATAQTPYKPSPALEELEYALLPVEESLHRQEEVSGPKRSSRPELLSTDEVCRASGKGKSWIY